MLLLVTVLLIGAAAAQQKCCTPPQWEAYVDTAAGYTEGYSSPSLFVGVARVHVDSTGKRIASSHVVEQDGRLFEYKLIDDFTKGKRLYIQGDECRITPLSDDFKGVCVPESARPGRSSVYGAGTDSLTVQGWEYEEDGAKHYFHVSANCIPVNSVRSQVAEDLARDPSIIEFYTFNNVSAGIKDPTVFNTPSQCIAVKSVRESDEFKFLKKIMRPL